MFLIIGEAPALVRSITERLSSEQQPFAWIDGDDRAFERAFRLGATGVIVVETLTHHSDARVRAALSALEAPVRGPRQLILVTHRRDDDELLTEIRRRGVPYVIIRARRIIDVTGVDGGDVLVCDEDVRATRDAVAMAEVVDTVARARTTDDWTGRTIELKPNSALIEAVRRAGGRAKTASRLRVRAAQVIGVPVLVVDGDDAFVDRGEAIRAA